MQLTATRLAVLAALASAHAWADPAPANEARARISVYGDDDATAIVTSAIQAQIAASDSITLRALYLVDVVSSASVDVVASATRSMSETRHEVRAGGDLRLPDILLSADYARSEENDYGSHHLSLGGAIDLAQRSTTLWASTGLVVSAVGRSGDDNFRAPADSAMVSAGVTQIIDRQMLLSAGYSGQRDHGLLSSPYRFVRLSDGSAAPETHPTQRWRHALVVRARRSLGTRTAVRLDERVYFDSWGLEASSTNMALTLELDRGLDLELRNRLHVQSGASFYQRRYAKRLQWMSADRELSALLDDFVGAALVLHGGPIGPAHAVRIDLRADVFHYRFWDSDLIQSRTGTMLSLGVEAEL